MLTFDQKYLFEDPEIRNFQFFARPETFGMHGGGYRVDGILAVDEGQQRTSSYEAVLFFYTKFDSYDFDKVYHSCFTDWWIEVRDTSMEVVVENDRLVVKKKDEE